MFFSKFKMSQRTMIDKSLIMHFEDSIKQRQEDEKKLEYFLEENLDLKAKMKILESKLKSQQDVSMTLNMHLNATIEEIKMLRNTSSFFQKR